MNFAVLHFLVWLAVIGPFFSSRDMNCLIFRLDKCNLIHWCWYSHYSFLYYSSFGELLHWGAEKDGDSEPCSHHQPASPIFFPQTSRHMVQRRTQDYPQQPNVGVFLTVGLSVCLFPSLAHIHVYIVTYGDTPVTSVCNKILPEIKC